MNKNFNIGFAEGTKNAEIFKTTSPYNNHYQGNNARWLFVCILCVIVYYSDFKLFCQVYNPVNLTQVGHTGL